MGPFSLQRQGIVFVALGFLFLASSCGGHKTVSVYTPPSGSAREQIVGAARSVLGQPYRFGAKGPESFDCSGLVVYAYDAAGVTVPPPAEVMLKLGYEVEGSLALPGDLVFFSLGKEYHVGIIVNGSAFVHASKSRGVAIDRLDSAYWKKRVLSFRRLL